MEISQILDRKGSFVATISPTATIAEAAHELTSRFIGALVVSDDGAKILGILSERDIVRAISEFGGGIMNAQVTVLMSSEVRSCAPSDHVDSLMETMTDHRIRHLPVVVDGSLAGIVSIGDLVKSRLDELERDRDALEQFITAR